MNTVKINILQWNSQSVLPKRIDLEQILFLEKVHIAALCETWLNSDCNFNIKDYNVFRCDRPDSYGGVAILTHKSIKAQQCRSPITNPGIEIVHVKIFNCSSIENVVSIYCPPNVRTTQNDWESLFSIANSKTLILGDYNGHHSSWSTKTDQRGTHIFDSLIDHSFVTLNDGRPTRIKLINGILQKSAPDLSIVSSDLCLMFEWSVTNESLGSDHMIIKLKTSDSYIPRIVKKRNFTKADWTAYRNFIQDALAEYTLPVNPQEAYNFF